MQERGGRGRSRQVSVLIAVVVAVVVVYIQLEGGAWNRIRIDRVKGNSGKKSMDSRLFLHTIRYVYVYVFYGIYENGSG